MDNLKICNKCNVSKKENEFHFYTSKKAKRRATCIDCAKEHYQNNKISILNQHANWRNKNKEHLKNYYDTDHYRSLSRKAALKRRLNGKVQKYEQDKKRSDPAFRLRKYLSTKIARAIKNAGSKKHMSFLKFVSYTMKDLKDHLTKQFESWMTWDNHGSYRYNLWNDNDPSTWKWQIDHIIPHSNLPYTSMEDDNFKKCWSLDNLRPLSAKQNLIDGTRKIRHI